MVVARSNNLVTVQCVELGRWKVKEREIGAREEEEKGEDNSQDTTFTIAHTHTHVAYHSSSKTLNIITIETITCNSSCI